MKEDKYFVPVEKRRPVFTLFDQLDSEWCLDQAKWIIENIPITEYGNASGKFYKNYKTWQFYKDSSIPLVKEVLRVIEENNSKFQKIYGNIPVPNFLVLNQVDDSAEEMCVWHKDRYFFNGQYHCTIKGNGNVLVDMEDGTTQLINLPDGSVWFFNSTEWKHKIQPTSGERIEVCLPMDQLEEHVRSKKFAVVENEYRYMDGNNERYIQARKHAAKAVESAVKAGTASNVSVSYPVDLE